MGSFGLEQAEDRTTQEIDHRAADLQQRELLTERQARSRAFAEVWLKRNKDTRR